jgi:hypothetical protein
VLTDAPIGLGTRYRMVFTSAPSVVSECVRFEPPSVWEMVGRVQGHEVWLEGPGAANR